MNHTSLAAEALPDLSAAPRTRLRTTWGTVLYVDAVSGELRHGPADASPANLVLGAGPPEEEPRVGFLLHESEDGPDPINCRADDCRTSSSLKPTVPAPHATRLEIQLLEQGQIGLKSGGFYLSAEQGGRGTLTRPACNAWEKFVPADNWHSLLRSQRRFARRRVIVLRHRGNLANKMLQYMGALTLASRIKDCRVVNVSIPELGIEIPDDTQGQLFLDNIDMRSWDPFRPHLHELANTANRSESMRIMLADHLLRMEFLLDGRSTSACYRNLPALTPDSRTRIS